MSLASNIQTYATRAGGEAKALRTLINGNAADLSGLSTTAKTNLVAALNELKAAVDAAGAGVAIDDAGTGTGVAWSASKIATEINAALSALTSGAPTALDTLNELAAALGDDANFASTTTTALGNRVRVDAGQTLTSQQKTQARTNIDAASATDVGSTATDFVAAFEAALV